MSVKKKLQNSVDKFIDQGADVRTAKGAGFKNVLIRIPTDILSEIDACVERKPWITRTQWVVEAIHCRLKETC